MDNTPSLNLIGQFGFIKTGEQWDNEDGLEWVFELNVHSDNSAWCDAAARSRWASGGSVRAQGTARPRCPAVSFTIKFHANYELIAN